jgi:hypothetical protein
MEERDRIDEREQVAEEEEAAPNPDERLDEKVEQIGPPPEAKPLRDRDDDLPPAA